jgi:cyclopropane-fatty-acyl-phospholipid synthase
MKIGFVARQVMERLEKIERGQLTLVDGGLRRVFGRPTEDCPLAVTLHVLDPRFYSAVAFEGSVGAGASYADGFWTTDDLVAVIRIFAANRAALESMEGGLARLGSLLLKAYHRRRRNTREGSARNIRDHYDLGNEFFSTFLDPTWMYSCAVYERRDMTLEEAQVAKLERICRKLDLSPGQRVLEIGTGWGGFAIHAARHHGVHVTTTTISPAQFEAASRRVIEAGLESRVTLLQTDYRDLDGVYDRLVSIEMIEAVGHQYFDEYFRACSRRLAPDGAMLLQAITIQDQHYHAALAGVDFIQRYIFPGCNIPSIEAIASSVRRSGDLKFFHLEDIGPHYARTLREWRIALLENRDRVLALGADERFLRLFEFYFAYCEGGFEERVLGDVQLLLTKPRCRIHPIVPALDAIGTNVV